MHANTVNRKQTLTNLLKEIYPNITDEAQKDLHNIVTISYAAAVHGRYQQECSHNAYQQLMDWKCHITDQNLNSFANLLADLIHIAIENLRIINYGVIGDPFYRELFFDALKHALPQHSDTQTFLDDLLHQMNRPWEKLPNQRHPLAQLWIRP